MGPRSYALSTHGNESEVGLWGGKKEKGRAGGGCAA